MFEEVKVNSERWLDLKDLKNEIWKECQTTMEGMKKAEKDTEQEVKIAKNH